MAWMQWINHWLTEKLHNKNFSGVSSFSWTEHTSVLIWEEIFSRNWFLDWQVIKENWSLLQASIGIGIKRTQSGYSQMQRVKVSVCGLLSEEQLPSKKKKKKAKAMLLHPERRISTSTISHWWDCCSNLALESPIHTLGRITKTAHK